MDGLLLFAHGARDPAWARPFERVAERLRAARPGTPLALAYLEFMPPGIEEAAESLAAAGCTRVHVLPLFLGTGGHVRRDIPPLLERLPSSGCCTPPSASMKPCSRPCAMPACLH
jgi:sirohydrochlorin cobaltochelatase